MADESLTPETLSGRNLKAVADYIKEGKAERIVVMTGAGISTAAGIPDFRSPGTGLYANLARLKLPYAEAVFDIDYFQKHPEPFYCLAKELYPGRFHPTVSHAFIALLAQKGLLLMNFTQNIDCLERSAGVPSDLIIEAHGSFATQRCIACQAPFPDDAMRRHVLDEVVPRCADEACSGGLVKPDIVFFGEALPARFRDNTHLAARADLVVVLGTSLSVYPFAGLPEHARPGVPRLLLNRERVGRVGQRADDVVELGACDDGVRKLAALLGWGDELEALWRRVVGDKEAARQRAAAEKGEDAMRDEVDKLTREVESALRLDADDGRGEGEGEGEGEGAAEATSPGAPPNEKDEGDTSEEASARIPLETPWKAADTTAVKETTGAAESKPRDATATADDDSAARASHTVTPNVVDRSTRLSEDPGSGREPES
ncbi:Sir2 histone deacetylase Hst2 [Verticillium nonalfalfae]|uniref:Sir2 histone deacetylase Hst2 n=1 Tax=Verticillium nonalfalfae TaxID=1051616 RepID=A0A3M9XXQ0_9PEZI|nr:Sir2 histone deacetylase Hst2 [Verticillium nonalfalfae]RNJ53049.1 Sir2 histone deacetylase Hst2 [Verticillium nonalfalfae]